MSKRILSSFLLICLLLTIPACGWSADQPADGGVEQMADQTGRFTDVPAGAWYAEAIQYCCEEGLMTGTSDTAFSPEAPLTRAMLTTILHRMSGTPAVTDPPAFSDAAAGAWYHDAVAWAAKTGIVSGYGDGIFGVNDPTTREQAVTLLWRCAGRPESTAAVDMLDAADISGWAQTAVSWADAGGLLEGMVENSRFEPKAALKRGEAASMLYHYHSSVNGQPETAAGGKILVAYFSATGNTRPVAEKAAEVTGGDLFEIVPAQPYTAADLDYHTDCRANAEQNDPDARPAIRNTVADMGQYDAVLIGYPIWWGRAPKIIHTFLESYDLSGKTIAAFCTSGSSGHEDASLRDCAPGAVWLEGRRFSGTSEVESWADGLDLPKASDRAAGRMYIQIGNTVWTAALADNPSVTAWRELLSRGPLHVDMSDYGGFEKVGSIGAALTQSNRQITAKPGDIILYQGSSVTIYYDENTWNFTPLGHIEGVTDAELREVLKAGGGQVTATFSLERPTGAAGTFDLERGSVTLNSGYPMPIYGLGTYSLHGETCIRAVKAALASGVRLIDTASAYGNEAEVGQAIREAMEEQGIPREEIFVTTKIYPGSEMEDPERAIQACLDRLNIGYVDLMLLHHPDRNDVKAYQAMEQFVREGKIRSIGLSNWYVKELEDFLPQVSTVPALVQNEIHPYYQENDVIPFIQEKGMVVQGWYPLGGRGHTADLLGNEVISEIAEAHGKSSAQVILRWNLQKGVAVIPGSSSPDHIQENTELFDFALTDGEMAQINALDRNEKHDWY